MELNSNFLAILAAGLANMVLGFLWYGPLLGDQWAKAMGWQNLSSDALQKIYEKAKWAYPQTFVSGLLMIFVFAHVLSAFHASSIAMGLQGAFWMWLGFVIPVKYGECLWANKSFKAFAIDAGYYLVMLSTASIILVMWK